MKSRPTDPTDEQLERLLGDSPDLGVTEREAMLGLILEKTSAADPAASAARWSRLRWLLAAGIVGAVLPVMYFALPRADDEALVARGAALRPSFSLSCLVDGRPGPCRRGAKLVFQLSPAGYQAFAAIARAPDGTMLWLFPSEAEGRGVDLERLDRSGVLEEAVLLDGPTGTYVVEGVFTHASLSRDAVRAALVEPRPGEAVVINQQLEVP